MASERLEIDVDPNDKNVQNLTAMREMADLIIINDQNNVESFQKEALDKLENYLKDK
jgi:ATP-dependent Clp protease adapter protein ClpS